MSTHTTVPIGVILPYAGPLAHNDASAPGIDIAAIRFRLAVHGWMCCDGAPLDIHEYAPLYGVIGNAFGADSNAGTFYLPDLRGRFIRGVSGMPGVARDPDVADRSASAAGGNTGNQVGSLQADAFQGHEHDYLGAGEAAKYATGEGSVVALNVQKRATDGDVRKSEDDGAPRISAETRPVNLYLNHIIRFR